MTTHAGFYTVIQYCPDPYRGEGVNVGVVVGAAAAGLRVRMAQRNEHVKHMFGASSYDDQRLTIAKESLAKRILQIEPRLEVLEKFITQESGKLFLIPPRPMVIRDLDIDICKLFEDLVSDPSPRTRHGWHGPNLEPFFSPLITRHVPIQRNVRVIVPIVGDSFKAEFAYTNGSRNLIKSMKFPESDEAAFKMAQQIGSKGLLLAKHPYGNLEQKLIVVGKLPAKADPIAEVLRDHLVRLVDYNHISDYVAEIEREAHN